jgi:hypothetical protein
MLDKWVAINKDLDLNICQPDEGGLVTFMAYKVIEGRTITDKGYRIACFWPNEILVILNENHHG